MQIYFTNCVERQSMFKKCLRRLAPIALAASLPQVGLAQTANDATSLDPENAQIMLVSKDGNITIEGQFLGVVDNKYVLATAVGEQSFDISMVDCTGTGCVEPEPDPVGSDIVLVSKDGSVTIEGQFVGAANGKYFLTTAVGEQSFDVAMVDCTGLGCIEPKAGVVGGEVELTNGAITLVGSLMSIDDRSFIINENSMGEIRVSKAEFECSGPGCP